MTWAWKVPCGHREKGTCLPAWSPQMDTQDEGHAVCRGIQAGFR